MKLSFRRQARWPFTPGVGADEHLAESFRVLRAKWGEIPGGEQLRVRSADLLKVSDSELLRIWATGLTDSSTGPAYSVRGWYHTLSGTRADRRFAHLEVDQVGRGRNLPVAQPVEGRFETVREASDVVEAKHRTRALDGV